MQARVKIIEQQLLDVQEKADVAAHHAATQVIKPLQGYQGASQICCQITKAALH